MTEYNLLILFYGFALGFICGVIPLLLLELYLHKKYNVNKN